MTKRILSTLAVHLPVNRKSLNIFLFILTVSSYWQFFFKSYSFFLDLAWKKNMYSFPTLSSMYFMIIHCVINLPSHDIHFVATFPSPASYVFIFWLEPCENSSDCNKIKKAMKCDFRGAAVAAKWELRMTWFPTLPRTRLVFPFYTKYRKLGRVQAKKMSWLPTLLSLEIWPLDRPTQSSETQSMRRKNNLPPWE